MSVTTVPLPSYLVSRSQSPDNGKSVINQGLHLSCGIFVLIFTCVAAQAEDLSTPHLNYILHCQGCHLADGGGTAEKVPALKQKLGLFLHVRGGREFLIQVPGTAQSALNDSEVAAVLNWMLETFSPDQIPADFLPYTKEEIARYRRPLANVKAVRTKLLARMSALDSNTDPE